MKEEVKLIIIVSDETSDWQAMYVNGELKDSDFAIFACDVADAAKDSLCKISFIEIKSPEEEWTFPATFEKCMLWIEKN